MTNKTNFTEPSLKDIMDDSVTQSVLDRKGKSGEDVWNDIMMVRRAIHDRRVVKADSQAA